MPHLDKSCMYTRRRAVAWSAQVDAKAGGYFSLHETTYDTCSYKHTHKQQNLINAYIIRVFAGEADVHFAPKLVVGYE